MAVVLQVTILSSRPSGTGTKQRAEVVLEDNLGAQHTLEIPTVWFAGAVDTVVEFGQRALVIAQAKERTGYIQQISEGGNPFDGGALPLFNDRNSLLKDIIRTIVQHEDPKDDLVYNGYALLSTLTDVQIQNLFPGIPAQKITDIRARAQAIVNAKTELDTYTGLEIE